MAIISNYAGIAVISLLFSSVFTWANTNRFSLTQVLTRWTALFPCRVLKLPHGFSVYSYHFPLLLLFYRPYLGHKTAFNVPGIKPVKHPPVYIVFGNTLVQAVIYELREIHTGSIKRGCRL
jgi:hypothetical protein